MNQHSNSLVIPSLFSYELRVMKNHQVFVASSLLSHLSLSLCLWVQRSNLISERVWVRPFEYLGARSEEKQSGVNRSRTSLSLCFVAPTGIEPVSKV